MLPSSTDTARAGLLHEQPDELLQPAESKNFAFWPFRSFNHNVVVTWLQVVVQGSADSIWSNTVLAAYVYELMSKTSTPNSFAGYVEAAQGLTNLVIALPVGVAADKGSKSRIVALGGLLVPFAVGLTSYAVIRGVDDAESEDDADRLTCFGIFVAGLCLWGAIGAIASGPAQALYADSVRQGERSNYYTILFGLYLLSSTLGPIVTILIFHFQRSTTWSLNELRDVFLSGLALELGSAVFLLCFRDRCVLDEEEAKPRPEAAPAGTFI